MTTPLEEYIQRLIITNGPLDISRYMSLCLTHPEYGYYTKGQPLGAAGDFTTAPEISQLFGEMIAFWIADLWQQMGAPQKWSLVELGPGRGTLMSDIVYILSRLPDCAPDIHLVEVGHELRKQQEKSLSNVRPIWHDDLSTLPRDVPVIIIANEFFDALPVHQFIHTENGFDEVVVGCGQDRALCFGRMPVPSSNIKMDVETSCPLHGIVEYSPAQISVIEQISDLIFEADGAALIIDYGYLNPPFTSTLQALRHHEMVSPLSQPGESDLTTLVNFTALAKSTQLKTTPIVEQAAFLNRLGIKQRAEKLAMRATPDQIEQMKQALSRLTDPSQMGNLFKVLCLWHRHNTPLHPAGFND